MCVFLFQTGTYKKWPNSALDEFAGHSVTCLTGNTSFPNLPVKVTDVTALQTTFHGSIDDAADGGTQLTALKKQAREALTEALDQNAAYVQAIAAYDLPMLKSSGYFETNSNHSQSPLSPPVIAGIINENSTQLLVRLTPVTNAFGYEGQVSADGGKTWQAAGYFPQARRIVVENLTPGTTYTFRFRALGGSTVYSDWSDPVSHMAM